MLQKHFDNIPFVFVGRFNWSFVYGTFVYWRFIQPELEEKNNNVHIYPTSINQNLTLGVFECRDCRHNIIHSIQIKMNSVFLFHKCRKPQRNQSNRHESMALYGCVYERLMSVGIVVQKGFDFIKISVERNDFKVHEAGSTHRITSESAGQLNEFERARNNNFCGFFFFSYAYA